MGLESWWTAYILCNTNDRPFCRHKGTCNSAPLLSLGESGDMGETDGDTLHGIAMFFSWKYAFYRWTRQKIHNTLSVVDRCLKRMGEYKNPLYLDVVGRYCDEWGIKPLQARFRGFWNRFIRGHESQVSIYHNQGNVDSLSRSSIKWFQTDISDTYATLLIPIRVTVLQMTL